MNEHDIVRVNETVIATPNFEDTPVEIKAGWRGALIADADKPTPCLEFNEDYRGKPILGGPGRYQFGSGLDSRMKKVVYLRPPIVVKKLASQLEVSPFRLVYDLCERLCASIETEVARSLCEQHGFTLFTGEQE